ncbi:MAG: lipopolysaccharide heptosyltransferase family protein [Aphanocapsa feldmannii 288cV]|nr:MAG: lipopolysaccharide heptosyltransferase family protein [Aphanocapsa feldmannii 288cV]
MRVLALLPGSTETQLQAMPAMAAIAEQLGAGLQVACNASNVAAWKLLPAVEKCISFEFGDRWSMADWANLLGSIREPDFQVCLNFTSGPGYDLLLSMSHIPTRIGANGCANTEKVPAGDAGWACQQLEHYLRPIGVELDADVFRLSLPFAQLQSARDGLPSGDGPVLLLAPGGGSDDWSAERWQETAVAIRSKVPDARLVCPAGDNSASLQTADPKPARAGDFQASAALVTAVDVVLTSDPVMAQLAVLTGTPLVALGMAEAGRLPQRDTIKALGNIAALDERGVLQALGVA